MPWSVEDVDQHKQGLNATQKRQWVHVANSVLAKCLADGGTDAICAPRAIREANGIAGNSMQIHKIQMMQVDRVHVRTETHQGRRHLVVPVVMMVEGVHNGSHGNIFHPASELGRFPGSWNGIPVTVQHPEENGTNISANQPGVIDTWTVGRVYNTVMDGSRLRAEAWLDEERIANLSPQALAAIMNGRALEVSVGIFSDEEETPGTWNNEEYVAIARNHRPDHLALLPGGVGACSWADGCGVRTNKEGGETAVDKKEVETMSSADINNLPDSAFAYIESGGDKDSEGKTVPRSLRHFPVHDASHARNALARMNQSPFGQRAKAKILAACKKFGIQVSDNAAEIDVPRIFKDLGIEGYTLLQINAVGYREIMMKLQAQLDAMDDEHKIHFLTEVYSNSVIYEVRNRDNGQTNLYSQSWQSNSDGTVTLTGVPVTVTRKIEYVTNIENDPKGVPNNMENKEKQPCCPGKVTALLQSNNAMFVEADKEFLLGLNEAAIDRLIATDAALTVAKKTATDAAAAAAETTAKSTPQINKEQVVQILKDTIKTPDEYLGLLPVEMQEQMKSGLILHREKRQKLIQTIIANNKRFTEENLKNRTMESLEELVSFIPEQVDYSVNGAGGSLGTGNAQELLLPAGVEIK